MGKGKRKTQDPCEGCFLHRDLCLCSSIPKIETRSRLSLVIHTKEMRRTTNTGILATRALLNSQIYVRGLKDSPLDLTSALTKQYRHLLFYPCEEAVELADLVNSETADSRPFHLIVPDGNWRQASKVAIRQTELSHLPRVMIREKNRAKEHLRAETTDHGMSTLQAIARAFALIENQSVGDALDALYQLKLRRTLKGRGITSND
jgi:DTW domain-containing protein YfiP